MVDAVPAMLCAAALCFGGCAADEHTGRTEQGYLKLQASVDGRFAMADGTFFVPDASLVPSAEDLQVTLTPLGGAGMAHTWQSLGGMSAYESYDAGRYSVSLSGQKTADGPHFGADAEFAIGAGETATVDLVCRPTDAVVNVNIANNASVYTVTRLTAHSEGGLYKSLSGSAGQIYTIAGNIRMYAELLSAAGRELTLALGEAVPVKAATGINVTLTADDGQISYDCDVNHSQITVTPALLNGAVPVITPQGFEPSVPFQAVEGQTLGNPVIMTAASPAGKPLEHVRLTLVSPILNTVDAPAELDLMHLTEAEREFLAMAGFEMAIAADRCSLTANFTRVLENLASATTAQSLFTLMAEDVAGLCSQPMTLMVNTQVVDLQLLNTTPAPLGIDEATVTFTSNKHNVELADLAVRTADGTDCPITALQTNADGSTTITVAVPRGGKALTVGIYFLGMKRFEAQIKRSNPQFAVKADAFATTVRLYITDCEADVARALTRYAYVSCDGQQASVWQRDDAAGVIVINGLQPDTKHTVSVGADGVEAGTRQTTFTTERALQVPLGDFEDYITDIDVKRLPSGGRYSSTTLAVYNHQNYTDVQVQWPEKYWASNNRRSFCEQSSNRNTWYMQPSAWLEFGTAPSGSKAVCVASTGWDHAGQPIPDYAQQSTGQSLPYNANVPAVSRRSAGRMWLGSYAYDAATDTETIDQGVAFTSRPSSLNGYYKYLPDLDNGADCGTVSVSLVTVNADATVTVVASGHALLHTSPDYTVFKVPLEYSVFNLKPTHLRIMLTSSNAMTDNQVPVTPRLPQAAMIGSQLWVDNLTFSY